MLSTRSTVLNNEFALSGLREKIPFVKPAPIEVEESKKAKKMKESQQKKKKKTDIGDGVAQMTLDA